MNTFSFMLKLIALLCGKAFMLFTFLFALKNGRQYKYCLPWINHQSIGNLTIMAIKLALDSWLCVSTFQWICYLQFLIIRFFNSNIYFYIHYTPSNIWVQYIFVVICNHYHTLLPYFKRAYSFGFAQIYLLKHCNIKLIILQKSAILMCILIRK